MTNIIGTKHRPTKDYNPTHFHQHIFSNQSIMASPHHSLLSLAASATTFSIILLCCFTLIEALNGGFSMDLIHRDSPDSPFYNASETHSQRVAKALRRSINRVNHFKPSSSVSPNLAQTDIIYSDGEYFMNYSVGTPPVIILGLADTGSDLIWLQCKPCPECYNQEAPFFDPKMSTTYKSVSCNSSKCDQGNITSCSNDGTSCQYHLSYVDDSVSKGDLAVDTFTLGTTTSGNPVSLPETTIGCGHDSEGIFNAKGSGIVGLGRGRLSLVSQLSPSIVAKFSYCLVPPSRVEKSKLNFGSNAVVSGPGTVSTPLVPNGNYYFVTLEAMSVGSKRLELSGSSGSGDLEGKGNIVIDSGTTVTTLPPEFYSKFESAVAEEIDSVPDYDLRRDTPLCYKHTLDSKEIPSITAHFTGADVKLNPNTTFFKLNDELTCLAFSANQENTIFGNRAQSNLLVGFDLVKNTVSFKPTDCTKL